MYGLFINLVIQILPRVASQYKFFGWWMIIAFLWASAIAVQLPPPHRGLYEFEDVVTVLLGPPLGLLVVGFAVALIAGDSTAATDDIKRHGCQT
jgi:hypothetical protein